MRKTLMVYVVIKKHKEKVVENFLANRQNFLFFTLGKIYQLSYNGKVKQRRKSWKGMIVSMETKFFEEDKLLVLKITEEIDECSVQKIRRKADYEIERYLPKKVVFDFDSVTFMDSAGIGLLIGRYKIINMIGGKVGIANLTDSIKKIFEMSGVLRLIPIVSL